MGEAKEALRSLTKELIQEKTALIERQFDIGERKRPENEMAWIHNETLDRSNQVNQKVNAFLESLSTETKDGQKAKLDSEETRKKTVSYTDQPPPSPFQGSQVSREGTVSLSSVGFHKRCLIN
ncbi:hypothetical protein BaRGS_00011575 [Batillaria attramentaria]|uniref:Uncharacterized protein n=1 Tax=Batillaria attramentaria TaxID=370345 RepID=A0ABD0LDQ5_9CAEN